MSGSPAPRTAAVLARTTSFTPGLPRTHELDARRGLAGSLPGMEGTAIATLSRGKPEPAAAPLGGGLKLARSASLVVGHPHSEQLDGAAAPPSYDSLFRSYLSQQIDALVARIIERRSAVR